MLSLSWSGRPVPIPAKVSTFLYLKLIWSLPYLSFRESSKFLLLQSVSAFLLSLTLYSSIFMASPSAFCWVLFIAVDPPAVCWVWLASVALNAEAAPVFVISPVSYEAAPSSPVFFFFGLPGLPVKSSIFKESPYFLSKVSNFSVIGKRLKSRIKDNLVNFLISANYWRIWNMSSGTLDLKYTSGDPMIDLRVSLSLIFLIATLKSR